MRKILVALLMVLPVMAFARKPETPDTISARRAFVEMPVDVLDLLSKGVRLDMLDYFDNDSIYEGRNEFDGHSRIVEANRNYIKVEVTPASVLQIKILPTSKGEMAMTVYTVGADKDSKDSEVRFFDASMQEMDGSKIFKMPELKDFFRIPKGSVTKMSEIEEMMPFYTVDIKATAENDNITAELTPGDFLSVEDMNIVSLFMEPVLTYIWDGKKLKMKN